MSITVDTHAQTVGLRTIAMWRNTFMPDDDYEGGYRPTGTYFDGTVIEWEPGDDEDWNAIDVAAAFLEKEGAHEPSCMPWGGSVHSVWITCAGYEHPYTGEREEVSLHFEGWSDDEKAAVLRKVFPTAERY